MVVVGEWCGGGGRGRSKGRNTKEKGGEREKRGVG